MVPAFNTPPAFLQQALESVLQQDPGPEVMQIEVVDDASTTEDLEPLVRSVGCGRVGFRRNPRNLGQARNLNRCIELARGRLVHLLHSDDFVMPEFYRRMAEAAERYPEAGMVACRSFLTDAEGTILDVGPRVPALERGGRDVQVFFYETQIQCPGVVVRREAYERAGGFSTVLEAALDREMWARLVATQQGVILPDARACYRASSFSTTTRMVRSGESIREFMQLNQHFSVTYEGFSMAEATARIAKLAWSRYLDCLRMGDDEGAVNNRALWIEFAPWWLRVRCAVKYWTRTRSDFVMNGDKAA